MKTKGTPTALHGEGHANRVVSLHINIFRLEKMTIAPETATTTNYNKRRASMNSINDTTKAPHLPTPAQAVAVVAGLLDTGAVRRWLFGHIHSERAACPYCGCTVEGKAAVTFWNGGRVACKGCQHYFTASTATPFSKSKLTDEQTFLLLVSMALKLDTRTTAALIGINTSSVRENRAKIEALLQN